MSQLLKVPLLLTPQAEGGYTITSPGLPELVTEIDRLDDLSDVVEDALRATLEAHKHMGKPMPFHSSP